jgi:hypothetical protein
MKTSCLLIVPLICVTGLAACSGSESVSVDQPSLQPISNQEPNTPAAPPAEMRVPAEQFVAGQLTEIDLDAKTFVLKDAKGNAHPFEFSETTKLTGGGGAQDLRGQEGSNATIRYVEMDNRKSAVQIHMELGS